MTKLVALFILLTPTIAPAQMVFERQDISIQPAPPMAKEGEATILRDPSAFNVEVRSEEALQLEYIHTLNTLTDKTGVMITFHAPSVIPLPAMQVFTAVDALFVMEDGMILQIVPNIILGSQTRDTWADEPVKALLFLKAGTVGARFIQPGDTVEGGMFTPGPQVMQ